MRILGRSRRVLSFHVNAQSLTSTSSGKLYIGCSGHHVGAASALDRTITIKYIHSTSFIIILHSTSRSFCQTDESNSCGRIGCTELVFESCPLQPLQLRLDGNECLCSGSARYPAAIAFIPAPLNNRLLSRASTYHRSSHSLTLV